MKTRTTEEVAAAIKADACFREHYGPDWQRIDFENLKFQNQQYGHEPAAEIHGWQWSTDFGRWSALVTMPNGWRGYTYSTRKNQQPTPTAPTP